jgi:hypothetical protein
MTQTTDIHDALRTKPLSEFTSSEMREAKELAMRILLADYYRDVRDTVASIMQAIKDKEVSDRDELLDRIHEECDGDARVIYTSQAIETMLISDNDSAYADDFGEEGMVKDGSINWSALAFCAFERDVIEHLESEGVDVNDLDPDSDDDEEAATTDDTAVLGDE